MLHSKETTEPKSLIFYMVLGVSATCIMCVAEWIQRTQHLDSCSLCAYQRYGYALIALLAMIGAVVCTKGRIKIVHSAIGLMILFEMFLSAYQVGLEQNFWNISALCDTDQFSAPHSHEDFLKEISKSNVSTCGQIRYRIFSFSLAQWNAMLSCVLLVYLLIYVRRSQSRLTSGSTFQRHLE